MSSSLNVRSVVIDYGNLSDLQKWIIDIEIVSIILNQRSSYAVVYDSSNKFKFDPFEIEKPVGKAMKNGETYLYAGPGKWSQKDIENIVLEDGFVLSEIWFYIPSKEKAEEIDPIELFENVFHPLNVDDKYVDESKIECLGRCEDGALLSWQNPNPADLKRLKNALPELCHKYNYVMKHQANAKENTEKFVFHFRKPHNGANFKHINPDFVFLVNAKIQNGARVVGVAAGAAAGTAICPGIGTILGAIFGGIGGSIGAAKLAEIVYDKLDIKKQRCRRCQRIVTARIYDGEKDQWLCHQCR